MPRRASALSQGRRRRRSVSSLVLAVACLEQPLDNHVVTPEAIQSSVTAMDSDFRESAALQNGSACSVLRKHAAGELVQAGGGSGLDQRGEDRPAGVAAAGFAGDIHRELADASVARPRAIRKRRGERDPFRVLDFGYDHKLPSSALL